MNPAEGPGDPDATAGMLLAVGILLVLVFYGSFAVWACREIRMVWRRFRGMLATLWWRR